MTEKSHRTGYYDACDGRGWQPTTCTLSVDAPAPALAAVEQMATGYLVPAIKAEKGLR